MTAELGRQIVAGGYWLVPPQDGAELAIVCCGAIVPEALEAHREIAEDIPGAGVLLVTSPGQLHRDWRQHRQHRSSRTMSSDAYVHQLLAPLAPDAGLITILDGHPATLSWIGAVRGQRTFPLGTDRFGQSGDIVDLYRAYGLDVDTILDMATRSCLEHRSGVSCGD